MGGPLSSGWAVDLFGPAASLWALVELEQTVGSGLEQSETCLQQLPRPPQDRRVPELVSRSDAVSKLEDVLEVVNSVGVLRPNFRFSITGVDC